MKTVGCDGYPVTITEKYPNDKLRVQEWIKINQGNQQHRADFAIIIIYFHCYYYVT
jgi:hypothetical protein